MYITDDFIFLHIPKTGGQSMNSIIRKNMHMQLRDTKAKFIGHHESMENISKEDSKNKKIYAVVRNPWRWYVCWYHFLKGAVDNRGSIFSAASNNGRYGFKRTINNLFDLIEGDEELVEIYKNKEIDKYDPLEFNSSDFLEQTNKWNCGLQSYYYHWIIFGNENIEDHDYTNITIGRQETSREDFINFLRHDVKYDLTSRQGTAKRHAIIDSKRVNVTKGYDDYREYYDEALIKRVGEKESYIADKYKYKFDDYLSKIE